MSITSIKPSIRGVSTVIFFLPAHDLWLHYSWNYLCFSQWVKLRQSALTLARVVYLIHAQKKQTSGPVSVSMLWAGNDLCWTALSQTISQNDAEEEPFNVSWKLVNFSPCLFCVCVCVRARVWQTVGEREQTVSQSADCFSACSRPEWWVQTSLYHSTLSASGSNQSNLLPCVLRSTPWSSAKTWCFLFFLLSYPHGLFVLTKGNWRWILSGEEEAARTCQEQRKTNGRRRKSWLKRQMVLRIQSKQRRHVSMHVWAGVCTFHCWI